MCGRYVFNPGKPNEFYDRFSVNNRDIELHKNYNVSPGEVMPTITRNSPNKIVLMKWGLIPFWAKDPQIGYKMINARAETVAEKPSFRKAFKTQRCLIPSSGFYEWKRVEKEKIPFFIHLKSTDIFSFAGLFDEWKDVEGQVTRSYTIITTVPNEIMESIHNRMPVILSKNSESVWLDTSVTDTDTLKILLGPYDKKDMEAYPVSTRINKPINNDSELVKPV